jgi:hypothetical protein
MQSRRCECIAPLLPMLAMLLPQCEHDRGNCTRTPTMGEAGVDDGTDDGTDGGLKKSSCCMDVVLWRAPPLRVPKVGLRFCCFAKRRSALEPIMTSVRFRAVAVDR